MNGLRRVLVVAKRSTYDLYVREHGLPRVSELLARGDITVARLVRADEHHRRTLEETHAALEALGAKVTVRARDRVGDTDGFDLVVSVGGDGTLLWVSHFVGSRVPMLGVNSAPFDSIGFLCGASMGGVRAHLDAIVRGEVSRLRLARMKVTVDGETVHDRVLNDALFCHPQPANTSRYLVHLEQRLEEQKSSGLWISTAAGSTAAIRSAGGRRLSLSSRMLQFVVREPYRAEGAPYALERGLVKPWQPFEILNKMRQARLFIDGPRVTSTVEIGQHVGFALSGEPLCLYGVSRRARPSLSRREQQSLSRSTGP